MHGLQSFVVIWEVTLNHPHSIKAIRKAGIFRDTLEIVVDDEIMLIEKIGGFKLSGSQELLIDGETVEVQWQWGILSGSPKKITLLHNEQVIAAYPSKTGLVLKTDTRKEGQIKQLAKATSVKQLRMITTRVQIEEKLRGGASWFYWIAGLSILNSLMTWLGSKMNFSIGLSTPQLVDSLLYVVAEELGIQGNLVVVLIALLIDVLISGVFVLFGVLAMKRYRWSFIVGMVVYGLDGILFLVFGDVISFAFHIFALLGLFNGLKAALQLRKLDSVDPQLQKENLAESSVS